MAAAASLLLAFAAPSLPLVVQLPTAAATRTLSSIPASSVPKNTSCRCGISIGSRSRRPSVRRNAAETYVPGSGKYVAPDYLVKKVTAKEVEELVRRERKVPLIVDFYATWCGPCVLMAQDMEMLAVEYENNALFVKVDTDDEYEFARDMQSSRELSPPTSPLLRRASVGPLPTPWLPAGDERVRVPFPIQLYY